MAATRRVQWFPGRAIPGVFLYRPPPIEIHDEFDGVITVLQDPYWATRTPAGEIARLTPGDWVEYVCEPEE